MTAPEYISRPVRANSVEMASTALDRNSRSFRRGRKARRQAKTCF